MLVTAVQLRYEAPEEVGVDAEVELLPLPQLPLGHLHLLGPLLLQHGELLLPVLGLAAEAVPELGSLLHILVKIIWKKKLCNHFEMYPVNRYPALSSAASVHLRVHFAAWCSASAPSSTCRQ